MALTVPRGRPALGTEPGDHPALPSAPSTATRSPRLALLLSECTSVLREMAYRGERPDARARCGPPPNATWYQAVSSGDGHDTPTHP
jgi:hypothetical protein